MGVNGWRRSKIETVRLITHPISLRWSSYVAAYWYIYSIHCFDGWFGPDPRIWLFGRPTEVQNWLFSTVHYRTYMEPCNAPDLRICWPDGLLYPFWPVSGPGIVIVDELEISTWCLDAFQQMYLPTVISHASRVQSRSHFGESWLHYVVEHLLAGQDHRERFRHLRLRSPVHPHTNKFSTSHQSSTMIIGPCFSYWKA
mgnify:CR=1 FL=1